MSPEALRKDPGGLDRGRFTEVGHEHGRANGERPCPPRTLGIILRFADDLHDTEDGLPDGRVENSVVSALDGRPLRRGVPADPIRIDPRIEWPLAAPAYEKPVRQSRSMTPAIAMPKPTHIEAMP